MNDSLLPIGSVVLRKGAQKRLMVFGRIQTNVATGITYDYSACLYPEGIVDSKELYMFNNENIQKILFVGFQDVEEFESKRFIAQELSSNSEIENCKRKAVTINGKLRNKHQQCSNCCS